MYEDDPHSEAARNALRAAYQKGSLVINSVVYAELAGDDGFTTREDVDAFLSDTGIDVEQPSRAALTAAGDAFTTYLSRRGAGLQCPECGNQTEMSCPSCGRSLAPRQPLSPDFLIGAHAAVDAGRIITFDAGFYRSYFDVTVQPERND
nr:nucleotide-binding protein [Haladaptatus sp. DYF46]